MQQLSNNLFMIQGSQAGAIIQLTGTGSWRDQTFGASSIYQAKYDTLEHVRWGPADNQPNVMRRLIEKNNQVRPELVTLRDMIYGTGGVWKQVQNDGTVIPFYDKKLADWERRTKLWKYEVAAINQYIDNANVFTRFELNVGKNEPVLSVSDSFFTRCTKPKALKNGVFEYQTNPYFGEMQNFDRSETEYIRKFDAETFNLDLVQMMHSKEDVPGNPFYAFPTWWGAAEWIDLANLIPVFHRNGIDNGYNIKYLIKMPADYFGDDSSVEAKAKWGQFERKAGQMLSGKEKVNKSMFIKYMRGDDGKALDSIDVVPLKNEMSDDAYSKILEMANLSIANSIGLLPTLGGVNPGKGNDSGSQIRVMADYQQQFRTVVPRTIITEAANEAAWMMGYNNIFRWFDGISLTTLDANPTGSEATGNIQSKNAA